MNMAQESELTAGADVRRRWQQYEYINQPRRQKMKKPSWKTLAALFVVIFTVTTIAFAAYHIGRAKSPSLKVIFDSYGLDANAITAYFTALAFMGFLITSLYQALCNFVTEQHLEEETEQRTPTRLSLFDCSDCATAFVLRPWRR